MDAYIRAADIIGNKKTSPFRSTDSGTRAALLFVLFHQRVCGPLAHSLFRRRTTQSAAPISKIEAAYRKADRSIDQVIQLLAA